MIQIILKDLQNLEKQRQIFRSSDEAEPQKTKLQFFRLKAETLTVEWHLLLKFEL